MEIRLIIGLGNPGDRYRDTRHNAGFWWLDELAARYRVAFRAESRHHGEIARAPIEGRDLWLLRPATFMNHSGRSVAAFAGFYRIPPESMLVVHDDIDLDPGAVRFKRGGGHGGHNGLRDIVSALGSRDFCRLRLGVGHPGSRDDVVDYVLRKPSREERQRIDQAMDRALDHLPDLLTGDAPRIMNRLHAPT